MADSLLFPRKVPMTARLSAPSASGGAVVSGEEFFVDLVASLDAKSGAPKGVVKMRPVDLPAGPLKDMLERLDNQSLDRAIESKVPALKAAAGGKPPGGGIFGKLRAPKAKRLGASLLKGLAFALAAAMLEQVLEEYIEGSPEAGVPEDRFEEEEEIGLDVVAAALESLTWSNREREKKRMRRRENRRRVLIHVWSRSRP
jgi:hypothetical protein